MRWWLLAICGCADPDPLPCAVASPAPEAAAAPTCLDVCDGEGEPRCPETCGAPLTFDWLVTLPGGSCSRLPVIAADVPGWVLVGGAAAAELHFQLWAAAIDPSGCVLWEEREGEYEAFHREHAIRAVAGRADVGYYAVGVERGGQDIDRLGTPWVRRYLPSGDVAWTWTEETATVQTARAVAIAPDGGPIIGGAAYNGEHSRAWLRTMTREGATTDLWWLGDAYDSQVVDVVVNGRGRMWASIRMPDFYFYGGWFGEVVDRSFAWLQNDINGEVTRLALASDDAVIAVESTLASAPLLVSKWSPEGELVWSTERAGYNGIRLTRSVELADGRILAVGGLVDSFGEAHGTRLVTLDAEGRVISVQAVPGVDGGQASGISVAPTGAVYITGGDSECRVWVARLSDPEVR